MWCDVLCCCGVMYVVWGTNVVGWARLWCCGAVCCGVGLCGVFLCVVFWTRSVLSSDIRCMQYTCAVWVLYVLCQRLLRCLVRVQKGMVWSGMSCCVVLQCIVLCCEVWGGWWYLVVGCSVNCVAVCVCYVVLCCVVIGYGVV